MPHQIANTRRCLAPATSWPPVDAVSRRRTTREPCDALSAACLAHELTQPLSGILLNASTCLRVLPSSGANLDTVRQAAELILRDVQRCTRVVRALRALFEAGEVESSTAAPDEAIREVLALVGDELACGGVVVHCELPPLLPPVVADPVLLQQVLFNLVRNAVEAMTSLTPGRRRLSISAHRSGTADEVVIGVHDTGPGIRDQDAGRLFTPFFTTKDGGMGLGLSLARTFAERHRGRIWMTPNDESGTTFWLALPLFTGRHP